MMTSHERRNAEQTVSVNIWITPVMQDLLRRFQQAYSWGQGASEEGALNLLLVASLMNQASAREFINRFIDYRDAEGFKGKATGELLESWMEREARV